MGGGGPGGGVCWVGTGAGLLGCLCAREICGRGRPRGLLPPPPPPPL
eukprot:COSAG03_NODE_24784_length_270_cov_0.526316_1_plen_46_part_01